MASVIQIPQLFRPSIVDSIVYSGRNGIVFRIEACDICLARWWVGTAQNYKRVGHSARPCQKYAIDKKREDRVVTKTKFIELSDGLLVEVAADEEAVQQVSAGTADRVEQAMDGVRGLLKKAVQPVASVWSELNRDLSIEKVDIQLALGFEAEGNLYIARGTGSANISFTLTVSPKKNE